MLKFVVRLSAAVFCGVCSVSLPLSVYAYSLVFQTGFEGGELGVTITGTAAYWNDCAGATCENNPDNCNAGCNDSVTNYNMPADLPGEYRANTDDKRLPVWNLVSEGVGILEATTVRSKNGSYSFRSKPISGANYRHQLNIYGTTQGQEYDNFDEVCVMYWMFLDTPVADISWLLFFEWHMTDGMNNRLKIIPPNIWQYEARGTNCSNAGWCKKNTSVSIPEKEWFQVLVYQRIGDANTGRIILKIKREGHEAQTVFDETHKNDYSGSVGVLNPLKHYGTKDYFIYWDDLKFFHTNGPQDLPPFDEDSTSPPNAPSNLRVVD